MKLLLDTNTVVSGTLWGGPPRQILDLARAGRFRLYTSTALLLELAEVLSRAKFAARLAQYGSAQVLLDGYTALVTTIDPDELPPIVTADPDDDHVLACAAAASADVIISGDRHLLDLGVYQGIPISNAAAFLASYMKALTV